jgi:hypothetical protein
LYIDASVERRTIVVTTGDVAERKRPEGRPARLVIEYYGEGEAELVLRMRHDALERGQPAREWVLQAIRERLERLEREEEGGPGAPPG